MEMRKSLLRGLGLTYRMLYRLPAVGDPLVRGIGKCIAFLGHHSPYGMKDGGSTAALRRDLERALGAMKVGGFEIREQEGKVELILGSCPYGFGRPGHAGVCDAAMEQDRAMVAYVGARLVIGESIPSGAPACRVSILLPGTKADADRACRGVAPPSGDENSGLR